MSRMGQRVRYSPCSDDTSAQTPPPPPVRPPARPPAFVASGAASTDTGAHAMARWAAGQASEAGPGGAGRGRADPGGGGRAGPDRVGPAGREGGDGTRGSGGHRWPPWTASSLDADAAPPRAQTRWAGPPRHALPRRRRRRRRVTEVPRARRALRPGPARGPGRDGEVRHTGLIGDSGVGRGERGA